MTNSINAIKEAGTKVLNCAKLKFVKTKRIACRTLDRASNHRQGITTHSHREELLDGTTVEMTIYYQKDHLHNKVSKVAFRSGDVAADVSGPLTLDKVTSALDGLHKEVRLAMPNDFLEAVQEATSPQALDVDDDMNNDVEGHDKDDEVADDDMAEETESK